MKQWIWLQLIADKIRYALIHLDVIDKTFLLQNLTLLNTFTTQHTYFRTHVFLSHFCSFINYNFYCHCNCFSSHFLLPYIWMIQYITYIYHPNKQCMQGRPKQQVQISIQSQPKVKTRVHWTDSVSFWYSTSTALLGIVMHSVEVKARFILNTSSSSELGNHWRLSRRDVTRWILISEL